MAAMAAQGSSSSSWTMETARAYMDGPGARFRAYVTYSYSARWLVYALRASGHSSAWR